LVCVMQSPARGEGEEVGSLEKAGKLRGSSGREQNAAKVEGGEKKKQPRSPDPFSKAHSKGKKGGKGKAGSDESNRGFAGAGEKCKPGESDRKGWDVFGIYKIGVRETGGKQCSI